MDIKSRELVGIGFALLAILISYFYASDNLFLLIAGLSVVIGAFPIIYTIMQENKIAAEKEQMFLEFTRSLVESVKTGTPISKSIVNMASKNYGALTPHIKKLANQIVLGLPLSTTLQIFAKDVKNRSISRSLNLIGQAEKAGGEIGIILEAVAGSVNTIDKLKKERMSAISSLVSQGYIIFMVFIIIILVLQFQIIPMISGIGDLGSSMGFGAGIESGEVNQTQIANSFLYLILVQGLFTGLTIGKLSGGGMKTGIKHSFTLVFLSFLVSTIANVIFG